MVARGRRLIVNISFWAAQKHLGNVVYGVSKAATDKMTADMAKQLRPYGVTVVSLYTGLVRMENVTQAAALSADPDVIRHSGQALVAAALGETYGFSDVDGKRPRVALLVRRDGRAAQSGLDAGF